MNSNRIVGLDFETYGSVNLPKHGLDRYTSDEHFTPLIASVYIGSTRQSITLDFFNGVERKHHIRRLEELLGEHYIAAHNAGFEAQVLRTLGLSYSPTQFIDSAMVARAAGAAGKLEASAAQLLKDTLKMPEGQRLIKLFSVPGKHQVVSNDLAFDPQIIKDNPDDWTLFKRYCEMDAHISWKLIDIYEGTAITGQEHEYSAITLEMNQTGWRVDMDAVHAMQDRYEANKAAALEKFHASCSARDLNLNSTPQMKAWCKERGVRATSFDEKHVERLLRLVKDKIATDVTLDSKQLKDYSQVQRLLETKQILGGSSLKKLQTIIDTVGEDGRLRDQYVHCGAGQTLRTTGRSVQMQNLKRITEPLNMDLLHTPSVRWDNEDLATSLRQVFTSSSPDGRLIVGDFAGVESRGLAWLAGEEWKLDAFRRGDDLYKVGAAKHYGKPVESITKPERTFGKVGELSCGYQAGPVAVKDFAAGMGVELSEAEAQQMVYGWRDINPAIVALWAKLDNMLRDVVSGRTWGPTLDLPEGYVLSISTGIMPDSLREQRTAAPARPAPAASINIDVRGPDGMMFMRRVFHGCHFDSNSVVYYKPSELKNGDLWKKDFIDPKTKQRRNYTLYGGKLAGILTQSFCRELFFMTLKNVRTLVDGTPNLQLVGQFHDEIILDWVPGTGEFDDLSLTTSADELERMMSNPGPFISFPLAAEVKYDYRYTK